jgi:hypothetical protein
LFRFAEQNKRRAEAKGGVFSDILVATAAAAAELIIAAATTAAAPPSFFFFLLLIFCVGLLSWSVGWLVG